MNKLKAAPGYVMFVYPGERSSWGDIPSSTITVIKEGGRVVLGSPGQAATLYLMKTSAYQSWRAAHPVVRHLDDGAAVEKLVHGKQVVRCDAQLHPTFATAHWELLQGNAALCRMCIRISSASCLRSNDLAYSSYTRQDEDLWQ
ncbi:MAG TPA: hypothetical protein VFX59_06245 [Polyangiales bacterium]|nr:hypothetical protein [Polyangiales bacterium]